MSLFLNLGAYHRDTVTYSTFFGCSFGQVNREVLRRFIVLIYGMVIRVQGCSRVLLIRDALRRSKRPSEMKLSC
jgi:hypothetical protein